MNSICKTAKTAWLIKTLRQKPQKPRQQSDTFVKKKKKKAVKMKNGTVK